MIDLGFRHNFNQEIQDLKPIPPYLKKSAWNVISIVVSVAFAIIPGIGWGFSLAWSAISVGVGRSLSHQDVVKAHREARHAKRAYLASLRRTTIEGNGQLINTRNSIDPVRIIYGIVKTGGTWVHSKVSSVDNQILNTIISWGEGEIEGLGTGIESIPLFSGTTTLNDLHPQGEYV